MTKFADGASHTGITIMKQMKENEFTDVESVNTTKAEIEELIRRNSN